MLLSGQSIALGGELGQCTADAETRVARFNHIVDVAILGCLIRIGEELVVLVFLLCDEGLYVLTGLFLGLGVLGIENGGSHIVMSCKQLRGDINYAWPSAEIAVMGASGAAAVLYAKEAKKVKEEGGDAAAFIREKEDEYTKLFANPYQAAKYGYIDDVIEPRNTRFRIIRALEQLATKTLTNPAKKHGNIPL